MLFREEGVIAVRIQANFIEMFQILWYTKINIFESMFKHRRVFTKMEAYKQEFIEFV